MTELSATLVYCAREARDIALEFGRELTGIDPDLEKVTWDTWPKTWQQYSEGRISIGTFDGVITAVDEPDDAEEDRTAFVEVEAADGQKREFGHQGDLSEYRVGRRMIIRYFDHPTASGRPAYSPMEIWLLDR